MRLSLGRLGLPFARGGVWTPAKLASLGAYWWRADRGVSLREAGPDWPSQGSHVRGLYFDGTNSVDLGDNALYDNTAIAASYTFLVHIDTNEISANGYVYSEGRSSSATPFLGLRISTSAQLTVFLRDDSNTLTANKTVSLTDEAWSVVTVVFDAAGMGIVVNGTASLALGTAYDNTPATTTLNLATIGALRQASLSSYFTGPVAYGMRHDSALTLAQCRQVQQYIAEQVAGDGITLTIAGSETANANSPLNHWPMNEDAAGAEVADIAGSVTGVRQPGDRVTAWVDQLQGASLAQGNTANQPYAIAELFNGETGIRFKNADPNALDWQSPPTLSGAVTHLMVVHFRGPFSGNKYVLDSTTSGSNIGHGWGWVGLVSGSGVSAFRRSSFAITNWTTSAAINQQRAVALTIGGTGTPDNKAYLDGGSDLLTSAYTDTLGSTGVRIGSAAASLTSSFAVDMDIREWIVVPAALDAATLNKWLAYVERTASIAYTEAS